MNILGAVFAAWLNASQRSQVGVGMNGWVKCFEWSQGLYTALHKNLSLLFCCFYKYNLYKACVQLKFECTAGNTGFTLIGLLGC